VPPAGIERFRFSESWSEDGTCKHYLDINLDTSAAHFTKDLGLFHRKALNLRISACNELERCEKVLLTGGLHSVPNFRNL
jgi:hypothetical protein